MDIFIYYFEYFKANLPAVLVASLSFAPALFGIAKAAFNWNRGQLIEYYKYCSKASFSGFIALVFLWSTLFGGDLSVSSTSALIFGVVPFLSTIAYWIPVPIPNTIIERQKKTGNKDNNVLLPIMVPIATTLVLFFGIIKITWENGKETLAENSTNTQALHLLYNKMEDQESENIWVFVYMAQNDNTPSDILVKLSEFHSPKVRVFVAKNKNTPVFIRNKLKFDEIDYVSKAAKRYK